MLLVFVFLSSSPPLLSPGFRLSPSFCVSFSFGPLWWKVGLEVVFGWMFGRL